MEDPFIREHIEELLRNIRTQVCLPLLAWQTLLADDREAALGFSLPPPTSQTYLC